MRHESAHIQRLDWICQIVASAVTSIFWFQPLLWVALNRIRIEAERAADDQVLESGVDATAYAVELVAVARAASGRTPMTAVPMARVNQLEDRIRRILDPSTRRTPLGRAGKLIFIAVAFIASWGIGAATTAPYRVGPQSATTSPKVVHKIQPQYTQEAKAAKLAGKVRLSLEIDEEGNPTRIRVQQGLGKGLDQQAVLAVRQWKFSPGTANGRPVRVSATIEINFKLL